MPLSEYEQRVLDDLERDLGSDPKLKSAMTRSHRTVGHFVAAAAGVVVGLGVVLTGVMTKIWLVGIGGFALMITIVLWALLGPGAEGAPRLERGEVPQEGSPGLHDAARGAFRAPSRAGRRLAALPLRRFAGLRLGFRDHRVYPRAQLSLGNLVGRGAYRSSETAALSDKSAETDSGRTGRPLAVRIACRTRDVASMGVALAGQPF